MLPIKFKTGEEIEVYIPVIDKWLSRYPEKYSLSAFGVEAQFDSVFLS